MTDWSSYAEQPVRGSVAPRARSASVIALPFGRRISRDRFMRGLATAVSAFAAFAGVLIVSATALILGLT
jgi:hypothetical protein